MKILRIVGALVLLAAAAVLVRVQFFNPFDQDVTLVGEVRREATSGQRARLVLAGPFATVSHPLIHIVNSGALSDVASQVEFRLWKDPDQLRAMVLEGSADFIAVPTNVAANLHNKAQPIRLLNVSVWGILNILSRESSQERLADFEGKELLVPFRGDMPDLVLQHLAQAQGLKLDLRYVPSPIDAMKMLIMRRADHALLAEPATSMALRKTGSFPLGAIAPALHRSVDLQQEWGAAFEVAPRIPQAGMAVLGEVDAEVISRFEAAYAEALAWYEAHPVEAGKEVAQALPMLDADAIADSIPHVKLQVVDAKQAQPSLEGFFEMLHDLEPKSIGGRLPAPDFYYD